MSSLDRLWAGWRSEYVEGAARVDSLSSLFEELGRSDRRDEDTYVLWRGEECFAVLNAYPYCTGHLLVAPYAKAGCVAELGELTWSRLWEAVRMAVAALEVAYAPDGINVGLNLGRAAGAGIPDHLHIHCLPRWAGDTNFMTSVAEMRVLPEPLPVTWKKLRAAWPSEAL